MRRRRGRSYGRSRKRKSKRLFPSAARIGFRM